MIELLQPITITTAILLVELIVVLSILALISIRQLSINSKKRKVIFQNKRKNKALKEVFQYCKKNKLPVSVLEFKN